MSILSLPYIIGAGIVLSWVLSVVTYLLWRRMVYRNVSLLGMSFGYFSFSLSLVARLLAEQWSESLIVAALEPTLLTIGLILIFSSILRLLTKRQLLIWELPWFLAVASTLIGIVVLVAFDDQTLGYGMFHWMFVVPTSTFFGIIFLFGFSQSILLDTFRRSRGALLMSVAWFIFTLTSASLRWLVGTPQIGYYYAAIGLSFMMMLFAFALLVWRGQALDHHHKRAPDRVFRLDDEEWEVKFF